MSDWRVFVGRTWWGKKVYYNLKGRTPHVGIAGATGSGKSEFLKLLLYSACQKQDENHLEIHIIDLKGGATFTAWRHTPQVQGLYRTTTEALGCLTAIEDEMWRRLEAIDKARYAFDPDPWFKGRLSFLPYLAYLEWGWTCAKEVFLVIDEGGELAPEGAYGDEKKLRTACMPMPYGVATLDRL